jgi:hypothetical protein
MKRLVIAAALAACVSLGPAAAQPAESLPEQYAETIIGSFTSYAQAQADPRYEVVEARVVRIWPERTDGVWLYQEQAVLGPADAVDVQARERPYFQRIVRLEAVGPTLVRATTHQMTAPETVVGAWRDPSEIMPDQLGAATCAGVAERVGDGFWRSSMPDCPNRYRGAVRASSDSMRLRDRYVNWDRGWSEAGQQVWGPTDGGYIFERMER